VLTPWFPTYKGAAKRPFPPSRPRATPCGRGSWRSAKLRFEAATKGSGPAGGSRKPGGLTAPSGRGSFCANTALRR